MYIYIYIYIYIFVYIYLKHNGRRKHYAYIEVLGHVFSEVVKGYLRNKMITSQNMLLFRRIIMFCSQDIQVFIFLTIP